MNVTPSGIEGVEMCGPETPEFKVALVDIVSPEIRDLLLPSLPFSVIVGNRSELAITLLGVRFDMTGPKAKQYSVVHYADTLRNPEKTDLGPGAKRFVCAEAAYTALAIRSDAAPATRSRMNLENLRRMLQIRASLDCVAFSDGSFHGPDSQGGLERFAQERSSESGLLAQVLKLESPSLAPIEELLFNAVQDPVDRARRAIARKLIEALESGGREELIRRAKNWRCRMPLTRQAAG
jgi:hypothetical protein